jgi:Gpi18-like mannosyltransferase
MTPARDSLRTYVQKLYTVIVKHDFLMALLIGTLLIAGGIFLGADNNKVVPVTTSPMARYTQEPNNSLSFLSNWDGPNYLEISRTGYATADLSNFFPLYPIAIHVVGYVISSPLDSALLISWVCFIGAIYYYLEIVKFLFKVDDSRDALKGVAFFMLFPTAVFFLATYTESMLALFALGGIYYAFRQRYISAALFLLFATATHITGVFVLLLVAMILWEEKERLRNIIVTIVIGSLGLVSYMVYLYARFNNPLEFISAQQKHGWLQHTVNDPNYGIGWLNVIFIILIISAIVYWWNRRRSFSIYSLLFLLIPIVGGQFGGFNRYVLMIFPVQLMLYGRFRNSKIAYPLCICLTTILWAYFLFQYAGGYVGG